MEEPKRDRKDVSVCAQIYGGRRGEEMTKLPLDLVVKMCLNGKG